MRILVITGSPKGANSITLQTAEYLRLRFPKHDWQVLHAGARIKALEKDFTKAQEEIEKADLLLFAYPVYTFLAPSQLHRFVELMKAHHVQVQGKVATQITTSKHFYDVTAHRYVMENCQDMGMHFVRGLSADMDDLTTKKGQQEADAFFCYLLHCIQHQCFEPELPMQPAPRHMPVTKADDAKKGEGKVVIVTDQRDEDTQLGNMIARFRAVLPRRSEVVNIRKYPFRGGCLGCFHCATDGTCVYQDGFDTFLREQIQTADAIVFAFTISDHSMGAAMKQYDDRQFCNGHRTVTMGMPMGYLVSGSYAAEGNLRMVIEGRAEVGGNFLCGVATDEQNPDSAIDQLANTIEYAICHHYTQPANFLGVGGMKIFRDLIYVMRGMMKADHRFFKAHGQYDFPQKQKGRILLMYLVGWMLGSQKLQKKMGGKMTEGMLMPYKKLMAEVKPWTDGKETFGN